VDLSREADIRLDLRRPFPLADACASEIYCEHLLEHLTYPGEVERFLAECRRVLDPGGRFAVAVPDAGAALVEYAAGGGPDLAAARKHWHPPSARTLLDQVNFIFRQDGEHRYAYDEETLRARLEDAGFVDVQRREFDPSLDSEERRVGSLYMECRSPNSSAQRAS
jgi:predicted SAM-dependent methyltransferase